MPFGENLRQKRKECRLTLGALASVVGTTRQTIYRYENGTIQTPPYEKVEALAAALGCTPASLLGWSGEKSDMQGEEAEECRVSVLEEGTDFCVTATDDAMSGDRILERDSVFVRRASRVESGQIAAVRFDGKTMLRRIYEEPKRELVLLDSSNPAYLPILLCGKERERLQVLGRAVMLQSSL